MPGFGSAGTAHGSALNMEQPRPARVVLASRGARTVRAGMPAGPEHKEFIMGYGSDDRSDNLRISEFEDYGNALVCDRRFRRAFDEFA